jgi:hypothetical protein
MTTIKKLLIVLLVFWAMLAQAQNHEKKCWYIDYEQWNVNTPALHILCGNNPALNTGEELTLEMWVRAYTFGENRKVLGKVDSDGSSFQNGYVMGFQNLNVYTEIWNPSTQVVTYGSAGPIPIDSAFVHMATTYSAVTGYVRDYINGVKVGEKQIFPADPITANDAEFMIGAAPWDSHAYQFYGALDEVRVWNVARTEEELQNTMFRELQGDESGLVAYYNFNTANNTEVPDMSGNGNTGVLQNADDPSWSWAPSHAPLGDARMYAMHEPVAAWSGKTGEEFNYAVTENGFSVIADIGRKEFEKYVVFAHNGNEGVTTESEPVGEHQNFVRTSREWYVNQAGFPDVSAFVNLTEAAGQGEALPQSDTKEHYALLYRHSTSEVYKAMAFPTQLYQDNLIFNDIRLHDAYFCVGYSESSFEIDLSPVEQIDALPDVHIYPNPVTDLFTVTNAAGAQMVIANLQGQVTKTATIDADQFTCNVSPLPIGIYIVSIVKQGSVHTQKLIIEN